MRVLVVDDDVQLATLIAFTLQHEEFEVIRAADGVSALALWESERPDLVILDVNLPRLDGYSVLQRIRAAGATPVIMLTVRGDETDMVRGLDLGADDYIPKPFSPNNLLARVRAVLRRSGRQPASGLSSGDLTLDPDRQEVRRVTGEVIKLTPLEFRLLQYLLANQDQVLRTEAIVEQVWGYDGEGDRALVKQLIRRLRLKIEPDPANPCYIETIPNVGYTWVSGL